MQPEQGKPIVFFSWQSDIDAKTNRNVISDCLRDICKKNSLIFDEATNERCGSPDIASTIEEKIRNADIFVADVTIINAGTASKTTPNPNVLFELGIAQATLGWDRIILIVNTAYAPISDLPFDIKSHRAQSYSLSPQDAVGLSNKQKTTRIFESLKNGILSILEKNPPKEITIVNQQKRTTFERQFYEMLKIHCDKVECLHAESLYTDFTTGNQSQKTASGQDFFRSLLEEFHLIYSELLRFKETDETFRKAYHIFFSGIDSADKELKKETSAHFRNFFTPENNKYLFMKKYPKLAPIVDTLFEGRIDQLVPYYRHLFLLVKTVAQADSKLFTYDEKRQFLRVLRAQLSSAEQTLLFFNWLSGHGKEWEEDASKSNGNHFFTDYRMIHNIIPEQQPFTKESILQSILSRNPHYRKLNDEDTLFELIDEKEA